MPVFKRRRPEEAAAPHAESAFGRPSAGGIATGPDPNVPDRSLQAADTGLGVPPFRPAFSPLAPGAQTPIKESPIMGRSPFSAAPPAPQPVPNPAPNLAAPPRPSGAPVGPARAREPSERRTLVVGRGISLQGVVQDAERLVVEGTIEATMIHATELAISPGGVFKGEVEVEDAEVAGTIDGTLTARGNLIVRSTGRMLGTARCRRLQVEDGGQITGRMEMLTEAARAAEPARSEAAE